MSPDERRFWHALAVTALGYVPGVIYCLGLELSYRVRGRA